MNDPNLVTRKLLCQVLVTMVELHVDYLGPHWKEISSFMIRAIDEKDPQIAKLACEFWSALCESKSKQVLSEHLPT